MPWGGRARRRHENLSGTRLRRCPCSRLRGIATRPRPLPSFPRRAQAEEDMTKRRWLRRGTEASGTGDPVEQVLQGYRSEMAQRLEEGLGEIQDRTVALSRDIAAEVWSPEE